MVVVAVKDSVYTHHRHKAHSNFIVVVALIWNFIKPIIPCFELQNSLHYESNNFEVGIGCAEIIM